MAGTSELKAVREARHEVTASGPESAQSGSAITSLLALAESVSANPGKTAELNSECRAGLRAVGATLRQSGRPRFLPLLTELETTLEVLAAAPGANACAAVAAAMSLLAEALMTSAPLSRAREMVAIAELRGVRGAPAPWRSLLVDCSPALPGAATIAAELGADLRPATIPRVLASYRKSLLGFLKTDSSHDAERLSELSLRVARACGVESERRRWYAAGAMFACADESGEAARPLVKRLAVKLEQALRNLSEDSSVSQTSRCALGVDLEVLAKLLQQNSGAGAPDEDSGLPLKVDPIAMGSALERLVNAPVGPDGLLAQIADAFLVDGKYDHWLEARQLAEGPESTDTLRAAATRWKTHLPSGREIAPASGVSTHFAQAQAALSRIEGALKTGDGTGDDGQVRSSGIPVDQALLENLNLMAREIRGARFRAEANLGSLRGGLVNMERTIRSLRSQLESLEVESHAHASGSSRETVDLSVQSKFGALSRGIEELAGLKDALQSLTEETESALAAQAGEDSQLEQGLLKTRMLPVGALFEGLHQCVQRAAHDRGVAAILRARGAEVALERNQVDGLAQVLGPLLEACVGEGLAAGASPARIDPLEGRLELEVSRPRFDVRVDISYRGAPLSVATLAERGPALEALGAVVAGNNVSADGRVRVSLMIPGPPQPVDLLLVEAGRSRYALPLKDVSGVSRPPEGSDTPLADGGYLEVGGRIFPLTSLAEVLGLERARVSGSECVLVARGELLLAFRVDAVIGRERMLVKSPGPLLSSNPWVLGVVIDALAAPTLVLDLGALETNNASAPS